MEPSSNALLQVEHLKQYFTIGKGKTVKAVDDISFAIRRGETFWPGRRIRLWKVNTGAGYPASS